MSYYFEQQVPGFRFFPTEEELVGFYLKHKLERAREEELSRVIPVVDIFNGLDPSQLRSLSGQVCQGNHDWFFFCPRQDREAQGGRPNRITPSGYWKATGSRSLVYSSTNRAIGVKKTMVFYQGRAPSGTKTHWKVNEYRALQAAPDPNNYRVRVNSEFSLCRVYNNSGSFRSFDRRPFPVPNHHQVIITANAAGSNVNNDGETSRATTVGMERSSSPDISSSSDDHTQANYAAVVEENGSTNNLDAMNLDDILESLIWD